MSYEELSDREKLDIVERQWYKEAQAYNNASDAISQEEAYNRSDMLLDAYLDIAHELGGLAVEGTA